MSLIALNTLPSGELTSLLAKKYKEKAKIMSGGERQMLAIAINLIRKPKLMMFDEPTANLAPIIVKQILVSIIKLCEEKGITIILVEQYAVRALEVADNAYLMVSGRVAFQGSPKELLEHKEFASLYLGLK